MKDKYLVTLDKKITIWERLSVVIEADSLEEAQTELKKADSGEEVNFDITDIDYSYIEDSQEELSNKENLAIANVDGLGLEWVTEADLANYPVIEFPQERNYKVRKQMKNRYKVVNGTSYDDRTDDKVIEVLETCRKNQTRIVVDYGDVITGRSWGEVYDVSGRVGRSTGSVSIPIFLYNKRSIGGGSILTHAIISIHTSLGKTELYKLKTDATNI